MAKRHSLRRGKPRLLDNHRSPQGVQYGRDYAALEAEHGPFTSSFMRFQAGRVAAFGVNLTASLRALDAARRHRNTAKGRRPSERAS